MNWVILYDKQTLQIDHFVSNSFKMPILADLGPYNWERYFYARLVNPEFEINRDKKVVIKSDEVIGTIDSPNPIQPPEPEPMRDLTAELDNIEARLKVLERR